MRALQVAVVALAVAAAAVPIPAALVERYYARGWYPALQAHLTAWSNETAYSLFDALIVVVSLALVVAWVRWIIEARRARSVRPLVRAAAVTIVTGASVYLWFLIAWGFTYARVPLESVVEYEPSRVTQTALRALADRATAGVNASYAAAHAED